MRKLRSLALGLFIFVCCALFLSVQRVSFPLSRSARFLGGSKSVGGGFIHSGGGSGGGDDLSPMHNISSHFRAVEHIHRLQAGTEMSDSYNPYFQYVLFPPEGAYPAWIVADAFLQCAGSVRRSPAVILMGRDFKRRHDHNHSAVRVFITHNLTGETRELHGEWYEAVRYESVAIGTFKLPLDWSQQVCGAPNFPPLTTTLDYFGNTTTFELKKNPSPPPSDWAMVAVFSFSRHLLRMWVTYWHTIGVDTFYLYYNGKSEDIPLIESELADLPFSIVIVDWQILHWILTDTADNTCGQPIAINEAVVRWSHLHKFMAFYDTDEFLVLPESDNLNHFTQRWTAQFGPFLALRSQCAWSMLNMTTANFSSIAKATMTDLVELPIERGPASGREKCQFSSYFFTPTFSFYLLCYSLSFLPAFRSLIRFLPPPSPPFFFFCDFIDFLNVSALSVFGVEHINMHGLYTHNQDQRPGNAWILQGTGNLAGYHIHFLNEVDTSRTNDYRFIFMPKVPHLEQHMGSFIRRALSKRIEEKRRKHKKSLT